MLNKKGISISLFTALFSGSVFAHGAWIAQQQSKLAIIYGHGSSNEAYQPERITSVKGYKKNQAVDLVRQNHADFVNIEPAESDLVGVTLYNGIWTKFNDGKWERKPKSEAKGDVDYSTESTKYAVTILDHHVKPKALGYPLEIVPEQNPLHLKEGDSLTVKVLFNGEPLANAKITNDYINLGDDAYQLTDKQGKATLVIRNDGLNVWEVGHQADHTDKSRADKINLTATLSFVLHHHQH